MRYCCLSCGRFFVVESKPKCCPYCHDLYYNDNISNLPPPIGEIHLTCQKCNTKYIVETSDVKVCPVCEEKVMTKIDGDTLKDYQDKILRKLGI